MRTGFKCCDKFDGSFDSVKMEHGIHYSKRVCAYCKHFLEWEKNPNITEDVKKRNEIINTLLSKINELNDKTTNKRKSFLQGILNKRFLTPSQFNYFNGLVTIYQ